MATSRLAVGLAASAAALVGMALQVRANARRAEREHPPAGHFLDLGDVRLHYLEAGYGAPTVVLLHGNAAQLDDYVASGVFGLAARQHRVLAFDRPGYGYSDRPHDRAWTAEAQAALLAQAFARLGIRRAIVVGHSWGTLTALALALNHPETVSGIVLLSGYYFPTARADVPMMSPVAAPVLGDAICHTIGPLVGRLLAPMMVRTIFAPAPVPAAFKNAVPIPMTLRPRAMKSSAEDAIAMIPGAAALMGRYGELGPLPVSIIAGAEDKIVDVESHSVRLHQTIPGSTLQVVPGLGHMVHHGAPDLIVRAIEAMSAPGRLQSTATLASDMSADEPASDEQM
jgi:pimeloyl-ACP methyl ester carboxylesterase